MSRIALLAPLVLVLSFPCVALAQSLNTNILTDPGFNSGSQPLLPFTNTSLDRWMQENAALVVGLQGDGVSPVEGDGMLRIQTAGGVASQVRQRIDLSALAAQIAVGGIRATATGQMNASVAGTNGGVLVIVFSPTSPGGAVVSSAVTPLDGDPNTWEASAASVVLPPDTTAIEMQYAFTNASLPVSESGYGDDSSLVLEDASAPFMGLTALPLGNAELIVDGNGHLVVSNIGSSGLDGVAMDVPMGGVDPSVLELSADLSSGPFATPPDGGVQQLSVIGTTTGNPTPASVMLLEQVATATELELSPNFSGIGATTWSLEIYNAGALVHTGQGNPFTATVSRSKNPGVDRKGRIKCPKNPKQACSITIELPDPIDVNTNGSGVFLGDEIRFIAEGATTDVELVTSIQLTASDLDGFAVESLAMEAIPVQTPGLGSWTSIVMLMGLLLAVGLVSIRRAQAPEASAT